MYSSSGFDRYSPVMSHRRTKRSRSRSRRRYEVRLLLSLSLFVIDNNQDRFIHRTANITISLLFS
jgi:hypothetical protein